MAIWQIFQKDAIYIICQSLIQGHHPWNKISNTLFNLTVFDIQYQWHMIQQDVALHRIISKIVKGIWLLI